MAVLDGFFEAECTAALQNYATTTGGVYTAVSADGDGTADAIQSIIEECGQAPGEADHYKCYKSRGQFAPRQVILEDQFTRSQATVKRIRHFCNPAEKALLPITVGPPINDPTAHLTCYQIKERTAYHQS
jgi:hypothetical protein